MDFTEKQLIVVPYTSKFNKVKNKNFLDALSKSDARWNGKKDFFYLA